MEGRIAIVTDAGRNAMDADGAADDGAKSGRRSRVVLTPRRRRQVLEKQFTRATVTNKPDHRLSDSHIWEPQSGAVFDAAEVF